MTEPTAKRSWFYIDRSTRWQIAGIAAVGAVVVGWVAFDSMNPHVTDGNDAAVACQDFVKARLKAPATADFSAVRFDGTSPVWTVTGNVDAENSFGAKLRMNWRCVVELNGGWKLLSLSGLD